MVRPSIVPPGHFENPQKAWLRPSLFFRFRFCLRYSCLCLGLCTMTPGRKLFLTHAGELAHRLVTAIAHGNGMAIGSCAPMASVIIVRRSRRMPKKRLREMESTISREEPCCWSPRTCAAFCRKLLDHPMGPVLKVLSCAISSTRSSLTPWAARWSGRPVEAEAESEAFDKDLDTCPLAQKHPMPPCEGPAFGEMTLRSPTAARSCLIRQ